ncbi:MAG: hypothetical protein HYS17_08510 [Micavibrio aeruginosavorus]|uniref:Uncharacterized protein n=1 Tax=Micavibrio aeruginosavorus TaxID=349221 RepID=A0A7T5R168_9BACT|nr:MAG: hypothetical protein HYS17_08510 [Micavibrio aeruginosavorus]
MEAPKYDANGNSLYGPEGRYSGRLGDHIQPRPGFTYPDNGDEIVALQDHVTPGNSSKPGKGIIRTGDIGTVLGCRKPGTFDQERGYMGLVVHFKSVASVYNSGFVLCWDIASDPRKFAIRKPQPAPTQP